MDFPREQFTLWNSSTTSDYATCCISGVLNGDQQVTHPPFFFFSLFRWISCTKLCWNQSQPPSSSASRSECRNLCGCSPLWRWRRVIDVCVCVCDRNSLRREHKCVGWLLLCVHALVCVCVLWFMSWAWCDTAAVVCGSIPGDGKRRGERDGDGQGGD